MAQGFSKLAAQARAEDFLFANFTPAQRHRAVIETQGRTVIVKARGLVVSRHYF